MATPRKPAGPVLTSPYAEGQVTFDPASGKWAWLGTNRAGSEIKASSATLQGLHTRIDAAQAATPGPAPARAQAQVRDVLALRVKPGRGSPADHAPVGTRWLATQPVVVRMEETQAGQWRPVRYADVVNGNMDSWHTSAVNEDIFIVPSASAQVQEDALAAACVAAAATEQVAEARVALYKSVQARPSGAALFVGNRNAPPDAAIVRPGQSDDPSGYSDIMVPAAARHPDIPRATLASLEGWQQADDGALVKGGVTLSLDAAGMGRFRVSSSQWGQVFESSDWKDVLAVANATVAACSAPPVRVWSSEQRTYATQPDAPDPIEVYASLCLPESGHRSGLRLYLLQRSLPELSLKEPAPGTREETPGVRWAQQYTSARKWSFVAIVPGDERLAAAAQVLRALDPPTGEEGALSRRTLREAFRPSLCAASASGLGVADLPSALARETEAWDALVRKASARVQESASIATQRKAVADALQQAGVEKPHPSPRPRP